MAETTSSPRRRTWLQRLAIAAAGGLGIYALSQAPSCGANEPGPSIREPHRVADLPEEQEAELKAAYPDLADLRNQARGLIAVAAHRSLSDKDYPDKTVDVRSGCLVTPAREPNFSWVIQNPLVVTEQLPDSRELTAYGGVLPFATRDYGTLRFGALAIPEVDGNLLGAWQGVVPEGAPREAFSVQLERTTTHRSEEDMPGHDLFGDDVVYLRSLDGGEPMTGNIPGHVIYTRTESVGSFCQGSEALMPGAET